MEDHKETEIVNEKNKYYGEYNVIDELAEQTAGGNQQLIRMNDGAERKRYNQFATECAMRGPFGSCALGIYSLDGYKKFLADTNCPPTCLYRETVDISVSKIRRIVPSGAFITHFQAQSEPCVIAVTSVFDAAHVSSEATLLRPPSLNNPHLKTVTVFWWLSANIEDLTEMLRTQETDEDFALQFDVLCRHYSVIKVHEIDEPMADDFV